ncbi:endo-1,4-beta-xylanase [Rhizocola hellebori]|uniref:endo-1,4-beta-xylanase n=1 Tax=Rhizocola hellebori TaxID=1392758 RepID=UPI0019429E6E|nr:endo-1,4-beta-xylanase [Rhizocola hellebori]
MLFALLGSAIVVPATNPAAAAPGRLRDLAQAAGVKIGSAVRAAPLNPDPAVGDEDYRDWAREQLSTLTAENELKWDHVEPARGRFNFAAADTIVQFAHETEQTVRGHTLVWHSALPAWVSALSGDQLEAALQTHITSTVSHFGSDVAIWDVVNEPLNDSGSLRSGGSQGFWKDRLGEDYIDESFRWAHAANPTARLYLNEYGIESDSPKARGLYELVKGLLARGVPIHGIGFQTHKLETSRLSGLADSLRRFADLGLEVAITELGVKLLTPAGGDSLGRQADVYGWVTAACLAVPRCVSVTAWGFTDRYSWIPAPGAATMLTDQYVPKPAYYRVRDVLAAGRPAADPVAAWRLDEPAGTIATDASSSPQRHPAQADPGALGHEGRQPFLRAFKGNGIDSGATTAPAESNAMRTNVSYTLSVWIKPASTTGDQVIASQDGANVSAFTFGHTDGRYYLAVPLADTTDAGVDPQRLFSQTPVVIGQWNHVAAVWDNPSGHPRLYVNGVAEPEGPLWNRETWASTGIFHIGESRAGQHFHGSISDLRVYQRALPSTEIKALASPVVGQWGFDGHTGDDSWFHRDAAARNDATVALLWATDRKCQANKAISLTGTQLIDTRGGAPLFTDRSYSLSVWVQLADTDSDQVVLAADGTSISPFYLRLKRGTGDDHRWIFAVLNGSGTQQVVATSEQKAEAGAWTHLVATWSMETGQMQLFVDGTVSGTNTVLSSAAATENGSLHIGVSQLGNLRGAIDDVLVYQQVLTQPEISALYLQYEPSRCQP